jgi:hypothetical protein
VLARLVIFYILFLASLRFTLGLLDRGDSVAVGIRRISAMSLQSIVLAEIGLFAFGYSIDSPSTWSIRHSITVFSHGSSISLTLLASLKGLLIGWNGWRPRAQDFRITDEIQDLVNDIACLKAYIPHCAQDEWVCSRTLQRLLEAPPENYRLMDPLMDQEPLPEAWYMNLARPSSEVRAAPIFDEAQAHDAAHCIVAIE